ncbi:unnamed protein product [Brachionus calyciflorus]|uniref:MULE transposase domain-containing protein n=1 Tax=Brachionus calyciflorus TaxID=104777 RepID=A0A814AGJ9_9BILA|nr:unnamed protein product [Brachionus calyciflorus]
MRLSAFEPAINAFKHTFPGARMKGFHFHFTQALWKNIQKIGLTEDYNQNQTTRDWLNLFKSLAFLPQEYIQVAFNYIKSSKPRSLKMTKFQNYFESTWLNNRVLKIELIIMSRDITIK